MAMDRKGVLRRKAQTDMRRLAQQYEIQALSESDPEYAAELRALAEETRASADALKPKDP